MLLQEGNGKMWMNNHSGAARNAWLDGLVMLGALQGYDQQY